MKHFLCSAILAAQFASAQTYTPPTEEAIDNRVESAKAHLSKSEGGKLIWESIEAHGGLSQWFKNGALKFRWSYNILGKGTLIDSVQTVDTWSSRAIHEVKQPVEGVTFGWNGEKAWTVPAEAQLPVPPDFWALTPYYFVGVPHVLADPGTIHEKLSEQIEFKGKLYDQVKVTYEAGTGETPDDYYIALIDPESKQTKAVRYIVTDQRVTKGKPASPEKLITYEGWYDLNGVLFPKKHLTFAMNDGVVGEETRFADVSEAEFLGDAEISFEKPMTK